MLAYNLNYMIGSIATFLITLILSFLLIVKGKGGRVTRSYLFIMVSIACWSLGIFMLTVLKPGSASLFWGRFLHISASIIPVLYFHFVIKLISLDNKQKKFTRTGHILALIFSALSCTPYLIRSVSYKIGLSYPDPGILYPLFILYFISYPAYAYYLSHKARNELTDLGKRQLRYITIAGLLGFTGGALTFLTAYGINIPVIGPIALYLVAAANLFVALATYTVRLMDVELIRRRTLIFSLLYGAIVGTFVLLVFVGQRAISVHFTINKWIIPFIALFTITIFIRPLENFLAQLTDKVLYQRKYDYLLTLKNAAKGMNLVTDTDRLLSLMVRLISKEIRVAGCAVYLLNKNTNSYKKEVSRGFSQKELSSEVAKDSSFVEWLSEKKQVLSYDNVLNWIQGERLFPSRLILKRTLEQIRVTMKRMGASLCIPSFLRGELIGVLVLGPKLSGARYVKDDILLLSTLSNNAAIAFENARMHEELKTRIAKLKQLYEEEHGLFLDAASAFSYAIDTKDNYTHAHALKVTSYAIAITDELKNSLPNMNFDERFYETLRIAAILHDVGKIGVPDKILKKRTKLTKQEEAQLREHTVIGETILHPIKEIEEVFAVIRHHHENFDGTGYPDGLAGDQIPFMSRIIAVANTYDSITSDRPHRKAASRKEAIEEITRQARSQFDPLITEALIKNVKLKSF